MKAKLGIVLFLVYCSGIIILSIFDSHNDNCEASLILKLFTSTSKIIGSFLYLIFHLADILFWLPRFHVSRT